MSEYLVDIKNERLSFFTPAGEVKALNDVSIQLKKGEVLGIVGESGSGKSVTAYSLMGLTAHPGRLTGGTLSFNGHQIEKMSEKEMRAIRGNEISIIFQDPMTSLNPVYTIGNQIMEAILLHTDKNKAQAKERAKEIGYPLLIKATAGGGGKGIRVVWKEDELENAFYAASREAESAFGNGDVFLEKYLTSVRHVEMQVLADCFGNILCLGERDCSLQLNKQKVLEETLCPVMTEEIRQQMMDAAVKAAKAAEYTNAGTVEFLLAPDGQFYFIEMNTRLQVEHPITEEISGIDIVKWQIRIACRIPLDIRQENIHLHGHSIECRINARSTGIVDFLHIPGGARVHFDTALVQDCEIVPYYDSMLGKLIVYAQDREEAIRKMEAALCEMVIQGVETNIEDQLRLVRSKAFFKGEYDTLALQNILEEGRGINE